MSESQSLERKDFQSRIVESIKYPLINKALSDRVKKKEDRSLQIKGKKGTDSIPEVITYLLMKEKFDQIYRRIERISSKDAQFINKIEKKQQFKQQEEISESSVKIIHFLDSTVAPEICKIRTSHLQPRKTSTYSQKLDESLEINTVGEPQHVSKTLKSNYSNPYNQVQLMRKSRYRKKMLQPILKVQMSNNIKDYLSVQKISIKEMQDSVLQNRSKMLKKNNQSNLLGFSNVQKQKFPLELQKQCRTVDQVKIKIENQNKKINLKFKPPFQLYYYRDFMWKIGFSNQMISEIVEQYDSKIKFFVGPGNNSNLIKGIIRRRPWYQITDKQQDAHFVWTQIKISSFFQTQKKGKEIRLLTEKQKQQTSHKIDIISLPILNVSQEKIFAQYWKKNIDKQRKMKDTLKLRSKLLKKQEVRLSQIKSNIKIHNHFCNNFIIGNKKALFKTMSQYYHSLNQDVFNSLPLTFHIKNGIEDDEYLKFLQYFYSIAKQNKNDPKSINKYNVWIVKPGQNTNRGNGIIVCLDLNEIKTILKKKQKHNDGTYKTYILQKYIQRPLLYKKRKFDLRHYIMLNCSNGIMKGYWYKQGYVRTTSSQYTLKFSSGSVHLTNDAVQKTLPQYGKFEKGNKITYQDLNAYIKKNDPKFDFFEQVYPKMRKIATDAIKASAKDIDPERRNNNFQIFGLDFMIDQNYKVWLIQINTNPCLETTCPVLNKIIPRFIQNTFQICIDPIFTAPRNFSPKFQDYFKNLSEQNYLELVFDERVEGAKSTGNIISHDLEDDDDVFDDDGQDFADS